MKDEERRCQDLGLTLEEFTITSMLGGETVSTALDRVERTIAERPQFRLQIANRALGLTEPGIVAFVHYHPINLYIFSGVLGDSHPHTAMGILQWRTARGGVLEATGQVPGELKDHRWRVILAVNLMRAKKVVQTGGDSVDVGGLRELITSYIHAEGLAHKREHVHSASGSEPWLIPPAYEEDGRVYVIGSALRLFAKLKRQEAISKSRLGLMMGIAGCSAHQHKFTIDGRRTTRHVWEIAPSLLGEDDDADEE